MYVTFQNITNAGDVGSQLYLYQLVADNVDGLAAPSTTVQLVSELR
jgi:hypothetical protein